MSDSLRSLYKKATPGPWFPCGVNHGRCECGFIWSEPDDTVVATTNTGGPDAGFDVSPALRSNNAALIVRLHEIAPLLLEWAEAEFELKTGMWEHRTGKAATPIKQRWWASRDALLAAIRGEQ